MAKLKRPVIKKTKLNWIWPIDWQTGRPLKNGPKHAKNAIKTAIRPR